MSYWETEQGIIDRIHILAEDIKLGSFNNAVKVYGTAVGVTHFKISGRIIQTSCEWCREHVERVYRLGMFMPYLPRHPHCFLADTLVKTETGHKPISEIKIGEKVLTHRGRYMPVTQVHVSHYSGNVKSVADSVATTDHPFLTKKGWVRADNINNISEIMCGNIGNDFEPMLINLKTNKFPSPIPQQHLFSSILFPFSFGAMPVSAVNFNSNFSFRNSKINVVNAKRELWRNHHVCIFECFKKFLFNARQFWVTLIENCTLFLFGSTSFTITRCNMGSLIRHFSLFRRLSHPCKFICLSSRPHLNPSTLKSNRNSALSHTKLFSYFTLKHSRLIKTYNFVHRKILFTLHKLIPTINNNIHKYKGFVYNLEVKTDHTYTVGKQNLIAHNCPHFFEVERVGKKPETEEQLLLTLFS